MTTEYITVRETAIGLMSKKRYTLLLIKVLGLKTTQKASRRDTCQSILEVTQSEKPQGCYASHTHPQTGIIITIMRSSTSIDNFESLISAKVGKGRNYLHTSQSVSEVWAPCP